MALGTPAQVRNWGLPVDEGLQFRTPFPFGSMDHNASRIAIADTDFYWQENYIKIGDGNLQTVPDVGASIYSAKANGKAMIAFASFNIQQSQYFCVFHSDGTASQVNAATGAITVISATANTFYVAPGPNADATGFYPASVNWDSLYFLISNNNTPNDYWAWDGALLYTAGTISPQVTLSTGGLNYASIPSYTVFGGSGSGVVLSPQISGGSVIGLAIVNPGSGYLPGEIVQVRFFGGGSDNGAFLTTNLVSTTIESIFVQAQGSGYGGATTVIITPANGATATPVISSGKITGITLTNPGSGFTARPVVTFGNTGGGTGAIAIATLTGAAVQSVTVNDGGTNYFGVPTLTFQGGGGTLAAATAVMSGPGPIASLAITNGGSGYTTVPTVTISDPNGSGAIVTPIMTTGVVTGFTIVDPGRGYTGPTVTIAAPGGTGTTATATAAIGNGTINSVTITNPGGGYTSTPAVIVQTTNNSASAILVLMPFGVSGTSIETYNSQVWLQYPNQNTANFTGGVRLSSSPASISNFAASAGGLTETNSDRFLRTHYTAIRQSNGYLYPFGAGAVNVISNVQVGGSPTVKTLNNQNTDPQVGTHWRDTLQDFGRTVLFANPFGVFGLYGGAVTKVSEKMDRVFTNAAFPPPDNNQVTGDPVTPSAAVANVFSKKLYLVLMSILDPFTKLHRNAMVAWDEKEWFIVSQTPTLTYIGTQEVASQITAWGTDGDKLFPLLQAYSSTLTYKLSSKLWGADKPWLTKQAAFFYVQAENFASENVAPTFSVSIDTEYATFQQTASLGILAPPPGYVAPSSAVAPPSTLPLLGGRTQDVPGQELGFTISSTAGNHAIYYVSLATLDVSPFFG